MKPSIFRCNRANALIEFALTLPILLVLLIGAIELARYLILHQKLDKVTYAMADYVTQGRRVSEGDFAGFVRAVPEIMKPFEFDGTVILSSVAIFNEPTGPCPAGEPCIAWQRTPLGGDASHIGVEGGAPTLPGNYPMIRGQDIIVAEVMYNYKPLLTNVAENFIPAFDSHQFYKAAIYKPRQNQLTQVRP